MHNQDDLIANTAEYVRGEMSGEATGHDWWHVYRVWQLAKHIAHEEKGADHAIVEVAALLHDIADWKFHGGSLEAGPKAAREWLKSQGQAEGFMQAVEDIVRNVSYKGAGTSSAMSTLEGEIVQDADRIDALGAVGIARTFAYGGAHNREIYNPEVNPELHSDFEAYRKNQSHSINHFYEKLLLLKDRLHTDTAKKIAEHRHRYMEGYLQEFYAEWEGEK
jgi:uncharacterized protein